MDRLSSVRLLCLVCNVIWAYINKIQARQEKKIRFRLCLIRFPTFPANKVYARLLVLSG